MMKKWLLSALFLLFAPVHALANCTTGALPFNLQNNTVADATQVMANFNQISTGVAVNCAGSGANNDITSLGGLTTPIGPSQGGTWIWVGGTSTGTANAQVIATVTPLTGFGLTQGKCVMFTPGFTNTGATTLNVFGTGAVNLFRQTPSGAQALTGGELATGAGQQALACYDGTQYELFTTHAQFGGMGPLTSLASAATTDLGTIPSHNVSITGVTGITSFGSTALTTYPFYRLNFTGSLVLTYNATSLILPGTANITTAANDTALALYLGSGNWQIVEYAAASGKAVAGSASPPPGLIFGCRLSGGGSTTLTINTPCAATSDDQTTSMVVSSTYTKTFASFVVGSGNGALDTGSISTNTWYHVYEIERPDTGVTDYLFSTNATTPSLPANYTKQRRIGSIRTDATPNIIPFFQNGDSFLWSTLPGLDVNTNNPGTTAVTATLTAPLGVRTEAILNLAFANGSSQPSTMLVSSLDVADTAPGNSATPASPLGQLAAPNISNSIGVASSARVWTNLSSQVRYRVTNSGVNITVAIQTLGWRDLRGQF